MGAQRLPMLGMSRSCCHCLTLDWALTRKPPPAVPYGRKGKAGSWGVGSPGR